MNPKSLSSLVPSLNLSIFTFLLLFETSVCDHPQFVACLPRQCGNQSISFPFWIEGVQETYCGYPGFVIACPYQQPILRISGNDYIIEEIFYHNQSLRIRNSAVSDSGSVCVSRIRNTTLDAERYRYLSGVSYLNLLSDCTSPLPEEMGRYQIDCTGLNGDEWGLAMSGGEASFRNALERCRGHVSAPVEAVGGDGIEDYTEALRRGFWLRWIASNCTRCAGSGGRCGYDSASLHFRCFCPDRPHASHCASGENHSYKMILGIAIPGAAIVTFLIMLVIRRRNKWGYVTSYFLSRNTFSDPSSRADLEAGSIYFGVHVFTYTQLEEATDNFDPSKELGDGGFGTVYYGKLRDGREVAVKRLYEHNYKRMEQFINEIEILTRLRHPNLVSLYGCTSRHSRELLLVYEYIPNGTVADHLHGEQAKPGSLPWPVRINIAIETASALAYLHASDIIHRDVKTNNILLDNNFCVKVADFGLSRLFPTDVTHVSTAPQGTPGYVDPEYHQCYQLTDKSDVYSFGVVLIELISSMPAVDISRHRHEINLANLALNRIQNCAFNELVDPSLGFTSDATVERMTTSVAELAFQCLQYERELRPTMDDVLKALMEVQGQEYKDDKLIDNVGVLGSTQPPPSPESDDAVLLKGSNQLLHSPDSVINKWDSMSTTPCTSG